MTLGDLWLAVAAGDAAAIETAYLHRAMREDGADLVKGRDDIAAQWQTLAPAGRRCWVLVDSEDFAIIEAGRNVYHHWVRREEGRIGFEVILRERGAVSPLTGIQRIAERKLHLPAGMAELEHRLAASGGCRWTYSIWAPNDGRARIASSGLIDSR